MVPREQGEDVMKKSVLITGGAGFLGSHLSDYLINKGYRVIVMDNLITGSMRNIEHLIDNKDFTFIEQDVTKYIDIDGSLDYILHFASPASPIDYQKLPIQTLKVGSLGTHNALGVAKAKKAVFLLASTSEIYGDPLENPQREDYRGNVNCVGPRGMYDESKRFAEAITIAYHKTHKLDTKIARIFNTYGERMRKNDGRAIPAFIEQALNSKPLTVFGKGKQTRSFCYISDLIDGIYRLMTSDIHGPVNLGNPDELAIMSLAKLIIEMSASKSKIDFKPLPVDDPKKRRPDVSLAKKALGFKARVELKDGLKSTIDYFKKGR